MALVQPTRFLNGRDASVCEYTIQEIFAADPNDRAGDYFPSFGCVIPNAKQGQLVTIITASIEDLYKLCNYKDTPEDEKLSYIPIFKDKVEDTRDVHFDASAVVHKASRHAPARNRLKKWMIAQSLVAARTELAALNLAFGVKPELNSSEFYRKYCRFRDPPSKEVLRDASVVGFSVAVDPDYARPMYLIFFILGWGACFLSIDRRKDRKDYVALYRALDILENLAEHDVPLVYYGSEQLRYLDDIINVNTTVSLDYYRSPKKIDVKVKHDKTLAAAVWEKLNVNTIAWNIRSDVERLLEPTPKNPIKFSFYSEWKLREEQFTYLALQAYLPALLWHTSK